ncbi:glucokinase [Myxococcota bacterium]|nr:glucokinase [Myxococcota bacterium]
MQNQPLMVVDIGGTSLRVALSLDGRLHHRQRVDTDSLAGDPAPWLRRWRQALPLAPVAAAVAVAGPVTDPEQVELTNARLRLSKDALGLPAVLLNDLHAAALGLHQVPPAGVVHLGGGAPDPAGPIGVLGVGTGLGQAVRQGEVVLPGEGGHGAFAATDDEQRALRDFLAARHGYVDWEHVASGSALPALLAFGEQVHGRTPALAQALAAGQPAAAVALALADRDPACALALRLMLSALGTEAGNMGLRHLATGGVWLVGGVAARLRPFLDGGPFHAAFEARGRFSALAAGLPRLLVLDDDVGLYGAARAAAALAPPPGATRPTAPG